MANFNPAPQNPWIKEIERHGYKDYYLDFAAFAPTLAEALGGIVEETEDSTVCGSAKLRVGALRLYIRGGYGKDLARIEINCGQPELEKELHYSDKPKFPSASFDSGRAMERLAADIQRRILAAAVEPLAKLKAKVEERHDYSSKLLAAAVKLRTKFPAVQITIKDGTGVLEADVYYNHAGAYLSGRLNANGALYVDRISGADPVQLFKALGL